MRTFTAWCQERGYPTIPTGPEVVASYIAHRSRQVTHSTISRDVAAISAAHLDEGLDDPTAHHGVRRSEERRVGKECRYRWSPYHERKQQRAVKARYGASSGTHS